MSTILSYLKTLTPDLQADFAKRCGTTVGYLRKAVCVGQRIGESLAIRLERESGGVIRVEDVRPDVDWAYLRGKRSVPSGSTTRRCG